MYSNQNQQSKRMESDDIFHDVVMIEQTSKSRGFDEGIKVGKQQGYEEGFNLGWEKGASIGSEVGFYAGFTEMFIAKIENGLKVKERAAKSLKILLKMIEEFPVSEPTNQELFEQLEKIRAKFKQVMSLLGVNAEQGSEQQKKGFSF